MTSKTNNEEYHCDRGEPLDREEPSAEPITQKSDEEEPEDLDCPNCCEPFSDSRPATPACPNPACPHTICQPCLDKWKSSSDLCNMYCRHASGDRRFQLPLVENVAQTEGLTVEEVAVSLAPRAPRPQLEQLVYPRLHAEIV